MTGIQPLPVRTFSTSDYDYGGEIFNRQLAGYNALRESFLQRQLVQSGMLSQELPTPAMMAQQYATPEMDWTDDDLLGAAQFWGIAPDVASQLPREQLLAYVTQQRNMVRPSDEESSSIVNGASFLGGIGLGALQGVTRGLRNLPLIGESLGRIEMLHKANIYLKSMEEGVRSSTPESLQPMITTGQVGGNLAALVVPATAAWKAAGAAGALVPFAGRISPIIRGASQGIASTWLLEGGNPDIQQNRDVMLGLGARDIAYGAAGLFGAMGPLAVSAWRRFRPVSEAAANKTVNAYVPNETMLGPSAPANLGFEPTALATRPSLPSPFSKLDDLEASVPAPTRPLSPLPEGFETLPEPLRSQIGGPYPEGFSTTSLATSRRPAGFTPERAEANAIGLTKASTVLNAPEAPLLVAQPVMDDVTVARAAVSSNPGGSNIVQAVSDPAAFAQETTKLGQYVRYAIPRGTKRLDAIISDIPVTNKMVGEYEKLGVYTGQTVTTRNGLVGSIAKIDGNVATFKTENSDVALKVRTSELTGSVASPSVIEVPQLWDQFLGFTQNKALAAAEQLGGGFPASQIDALIAENMPLYVDDFIAGLNVTKGDAARISKYFNLRYVETFKQMAPAETVAGERLAQNALDIMDNASAISPLGRMDELAAAKGMVIAPRADGGFDLIDMVGRVDDKVTEVAVADLESAATWLGNLNRELPDLTPRTAVPQEVAAMQYGAAPQMPNGNVLIEAHIADNIAEMAAEEGTDAIVGSLAAQAQALRETGRLSKMQTAYISAFNALSSTRRLAAKVDEALNAFELRDATFFQDYLSISGSVTARHNYLEPLQEGAVQIMQNIRAATKRSGSWTQVYLIEDPVERVAVARARGFNEKEIAAFDELSAYWHRLFGETGLSPERELRQYMPMLQKMQSIDDFQGAELWSVSPTSDAFFKHVRRGSVNARELDPETLIHHYLMELSWENRMAAQWAPIAEKWSAIKQQVPELAPAADIMLNYMHTVRYGYQPGPDMMLDWTHAMAQKLIGPSVTRSQARNLVNGGLNLSYSSLMGYRPDIIARDLQQVWLALPRTGTRLLGTMKDFMTTSNAGRQAMWDEAVADNMVTLTHPRSMAPGVGRNLEAAVFDPAEMMAGAKSPREIALGNALAAVEDMVPAWMKNERLRPTYFYGRQGEITRMIVGRTQKYTTLEALDRFRAAGPNGDMSRLLSESKANTFYPAVRREFQRLVGMGADEEAAKFLGRQMADATQFKYQTGEGAEITRTVSGKLAMQLGSYFTNYAQYLEEIVKYGTPQTKAATLATFGGLAAAMYGASQATGWNFNKMNPFYGIGFTGGPIVNMGLDVLSAGSENIRAMTGQTDRRPPSMLGAMGEAAQLFNPMSGLIDMAEGTNAAFNSPTPGRALLRLGITGEQGPGPDLQYEFQAPPIEQFQQSSSPVRARQDSLMQIPPLAPVPQFENDSSDEAEFMRQFDGLPEELRAAALEQYRKDQFARQPQGGGGGQF